MAFAVFAWEYHSRWTPRELSRLDGCEREDLLFYLPLLSDNVNDYDNSRIRIEYHSRKLIDSARAALNDPFAYVMR